MSRARDASTRQFFILGIAAKLRETTFAAVCFPSFGAYARFIFLVTGRNFLWHVRNTASDEQTNAA